MDRKTSNKLLSRIQAIGVALVAASPYVALQAATVLLDLAFLFAYGLFNVAIPVIAIVWLLHFAIEVKWRRRLLPGFRRVPWLALAAGLALPFFLSTGAWIRPIVMDVPSWCRASQTVEWTTSLPHPELERHSFTLVLVGTGTRNEYRFSTGYLNWTGTEPAGFTSVRLNPIAFQYEYYEPHHDGTLQLLRQRIGDSRLPDGKVDRIAEQIWDVLIQGQEGHELKAPDANVEAVRSAPSKQQDVTLGGLIWMTAILLALQIVGQLTLGPFGTFFGKSAA